MALTHLAFWDYWQTAAIRGFVAGSPFPSEEDDEATNAALETIAQLVDPHPAAEAAVSAASQLDESIASLAPEQRQLLIDSGHAYAVRRWGHREEHLAQIEAALG